MHGLKNVKYFSEWTSLDCNANGPPQMAMEVLGGDQWVDVYEEMDKNDVLVVGGGRASVGAAGGYLQGGGHGFFSPKHGLAVDNLLEADIVIADGSLLTVNKC